MDRAYTLLDVKSVDEADDFVTVRGIASTPTPDRVGDVVEPLGAQFKTPMPLLWQHRHDAPVGHVTFAQPTKDGIPFEARIPRVSEEGTVRERVNEAIHSLKYSLVSAVSIGFRAMEDGVERMKDGGLRFKKWEWLELSLVTIPANSDAVISAVKSLDAQHLPATGNEVNAVDPAPGDTGATPKPRGPVYLKAPPRKTQPVRIITH